MPLTHSHGLCTWMVAVLCDALYRLDTQGRRLPHVLCSGQPPAVQLSSFFPKPAQEMILHVQDMRTGFKALSVPALAASL